jgi:hypothetical protein
MRDSRRLPALMLRRSNAQSHPQRRMKKGNEYILHDNHRIHTALHPPFGARRGTYRCLGRASMRPTHRPSLTMLNEVETSLRLSFITFPEHSYVIGARRSHHECAVQTQRNARPSTSGSWAPQSEGIMKREKGKKREERKGGCEMYFHSKNSNSLFRFVALLFCWFGSLRKSLRE